MCTFLLKLTEASWRNIHIYGGYAMFSRILRIFLETGPENEK